MSEEAEAPCRSCRSTEGYWFDRTVCVEPCGWMHTRCVTCGASQEFCPFER